MFFHDYYCYEYEWLVVNLFLISSKSGDTSLVNTQFTFSSKFTSVSNVVQQGEKIIQQHKILILVAEDKKIMTEVADTIANTTGKTIKYENMSKWSETEFNKCKNENVQCVIFDGRMTAVYDGKETMKLSEMGDVFQRVYEDKTSFVFIVAVPQMLWNGRKLLFQKWSLFHDVHLLKFKVDDTKW